MILPEHSCRNCGTCCGERIPVTENEELVISDYLKQHMNIDTLKYLCITQRLVYEHKLRAEKKNKPTKGYSRCQFRDEVNKKCVIYPVRPLICRLFGLFEPPPDKPKIVYTCTYGNSANINLLHIFVKSDTEHMSDMPDLIGKWCKDNNITEVTL